MLGFYPPPLPFQKNKPKKLLPENQYDQVQVKCRKKKKKVEWGGGRGLFSSASEQGQHCQNPKHSCRAVFITSLERQRASCDKRAVPVNTFLFFSTQRKVMNMCVQTLPVAPYPLLYLLVIGGGRAQFAPCYRNTPTCMPKQ